MFKQLSIGMLAAAVVAVGSGVLAPRSASAQFLTNTSFETPVVGNGGIQYSPINASWTFASAGVTGNNSGFTFGNPNAPDGVQVAFLQQSGFFSQTFTGAGSFSLSFLAAQRAAGGGPTPNGQNFSVLIDGTTVGTFKPTSTSYGLLSTTFNVNSGTHTLLFQGLNAAGGDNTAFIDAVSLTQNATAAPEPTSAAFLLTALPVGIGLIRRRRHA